VYAWQVELKSGESHEFRNLAKEEQQPLLEYLKSKGIHTSSSVEDGKPKVSYKDDEYQGSDDDEVGISTGAALR
jgi:hypothetical protein